MLRQFESEVLEIKNLNSSVVIPKLSIPKDFKFKPGQYVLTSTLDPKKRKISRSYSISSHPKNNYIELCVKRVEEGLVSNFICDLKKGDKIKVMGPIGRFIFDERSKDKNVVFISNSTGIGPFIPMIHDLLEGRSKQKIFLISGYRNEEDTLYNKELQDFKKKFKNFEFHTILSKPKSKDSKNKGYVQDFLEKLNLIGKENHFYICGLSDMVDGVFNELIKNNIPKNQIFFEKYD